MSLTQQTSTGPHRGGMFGRSDLIVFGASVAGIVLSALTRYAVHREVLAFVVSAGTIGVLAALVGRCVDQLGDRFGPGATGVLQSALGNLPELFIGIFALRAGLVSVVQAAIIGSILGNALLVLGLAFLAGGVRHGSQRFDSSMARNAIVLLFVAVGALVMPSLASYVHTPAAEHEGTLSVVVSVVLLILFALSLPASLRHAPGAAKAGADTVEAPDASAGASGVHVPRPTDHERWPLLVAIGLLAVSSVAAAFVSDWFITALTPAIESLHINELFAGLVIVAIAGNAVENFVGIQLAWRNQADYAMSVVVNSPLQIALVLAPALVLLSHVVGGAILTLVFAPLLVLAVALTVLALAVITLDGESNWLEGVALVGLYAVIATSFWWG